MKKTLVFLAALTLALLLSACGAARDDVAVVPLPADSLMGELPPAVASVNGDHAEAPCLLVGTFESGGALVFWTQINPEMVTSGLGSLGTELELPAASSYAALQEADLYGVVSTLSTDGDDTILAFFPLTQLDPTGPGNQQWPDHSEGEYLYPVVICADGNDCCLRSLMDGSLFLPATPLPPELTAKAAAAADIGTEISLSHCGIARFFILEKAEDGSYRIELKGFLCL